MKIRKGGYLTFGRLIGNHRCLWMDIPNGLIYGFNHPPPTQPNARRLKIKDHRSVKRCNDKLDNVCQKEKIYHRMNNLHESAIDTMTHMQQMEYKEIDELLFEMMENVGQNCRKLCTGSMTWSPTYKTAEILEYAGIIYFRTAY